MGAVLNACFEEKKNTTLLAINYVLLSTAETFFRDIIRAKAVGCKDFQF